MQSWSLYRNTYSFNNNPINSRVYNTKIDVCASFKLSNSGITYYSDEDFFKEIDEIKIYEEDEIKYMDKYEKVLNTNTYQNLIYNKKEETVRLFDELDKLVLNMSENIIRKFLSRVVVYKLKNNFLEVRINQSNLLISLHKDSKQFDYDDKLSVRKGYENTSLCYFVIIEYQEDLNYIIKIIEKLYKFYITPQENPYEKLYNILITKVLKISDEIHTKKVNKGLLFKSNRNFLRLKLKNNSICVSLLNVEDKENKLNMVRYTNYEPLCLKYEITQKEDIDFILPYIKESFKISKYNPKDLKNDFIKYYFINN